MSTSLVFPQVKAGREYSQHSGIIIRNTGGEHTLLADLVLVACLDLLVLSVEMYLRM
jgi:hypothetical protein